jgi:hypothetical protein
VLNERIPCQKEEMIMSLRKETRHAVLISGASILLAGITLLSLRVLHPSWQSDQLDALLLSVAFSVGACFLLFARRLGQAHMALGVYLLTIGGATVVLPRLLLAGYGGSDPDALFLFLGPLYLFAGMVLVLVSLLNHRHWMERRKTMWMRTVLLAGPGAILTILCPLALGPRMWDVPPYGFDLVAASWVMGIGIFFAGSRFVPTAQTGTHHETVAGSIQ